MTAGREIFAATSTAIVSDKERFRSGGFTSPNLSDGEGKPSEGARTSQVESSTWSAGSFSESARSRKNTTSLSLNFSQFARS
ncbi:hypothetical protein GCM10019059_36100 [Camelimonas fluminis]|nr:hypothetical protein GCM10019059_36100 [Camelimonas fluminis]